MLEILRNMARRKVRTGLTVFGIVIGIFALTLMGSFAEYFNGMVDHMIAQAGTNISISAKGGDILTALTPAEQKKIERVPGVKYALPTILDPLSELAMVNLGGAEYAWGEVSELAQYDFPFTTLKHGRWLQRGDAYHTVVGSKVAARHGLDLGSTIEYRDRDFTVVGILNETQSTSDTLVIIPIDIMRRLIKAPDLIMMMTVVPQDPREVEALAVRIRSDVDTVQVTAPADAVAQARGQAAVLSAVVMGGALMAVLVGGLAVVNTMFISITERIKEIGLKKAIGASDSDIIREYVFEAVIIGCVGGVIGLVLGGGLALLLNATMGEASGVSNLFSVTPRLVITAIVFAVGLSGFAGLYPALIAARLDPVRALRSK